MAFAIPVVAAIGAKVAALAGAGIGGTAVGLAMSLKEKLKHTTTTITQLLNLSEGDHISLNDSRLPFRHAIVVQPVQDPNDPLRLVYHSGSRSGARVEFIELDLHEQASKGELVRHQYEALVCYPAEAVVARAMSLCSQHNSADRREILRVYWPFFRNDEHFANWCQIGFSFTDGLKSTLIADYTRTLVSDVARLREVASCMSICKGDHIMTNDGLSGIVVAVGEKIEVARFPSEDHRGPGLVVINDITRLYRLEYDLAVGVSGQTAKEAAVSETTQPTEPMPYCNSHEFAVWCKTSLNAPVDWNVASALAAARMTGRVWAWVHAVDELRPGDHVAFKSGAVYYYQHAIVNSVEGHDVGLTYIDGSAADITKMTVKSESGDVTACVRAKQLCKYFYDVREWYDPDAVITRASSLLGSTADKLPFKDPQHFAMWCKTGTYQLHC